MEGPSECLSSLVGFFYPWRPSGLDLGCPQPESESCHPPKPSDFLAQIREERQLSYSQVRQNRGAMVQRFLAKQRTRGKSLEGHLF